MASSPELMLQYVDDINDNLLCCICRAPFVDPLTTASCSHTFCRECISTSLANATLCPIDRSPLTLDGLHPADPLLRNLVDELIVECPNSDRGCDHTCQRQLIGVHLRESCGYVEVACSHEHCTLKYLKKDEEFHSHEGRRRCSSCMTDLPVEAFESHETQCKKRLVSCAGCSQDILRSNISSHSSTCPELVIPCVHASNGCPWKGPRRSIDPDHLPNCPYESIKGFFAMNDSRLALISNENKVLRHKVEVLEGMISMIKHELYSVHQILAPWYSGLSPRTSLAHRMSLDSSQNILHDLGTTADSEGSQEQPTILPQQGAVAPNTTELASYFPPVNDESEESFSPLDYLPSDNDPALQSLHQRSQSLTSQVHIPSTSPPQVSSRLSHGPPYLPSPYYPSVTQTSSLAAPYTAASQQTPHTSPVAPVDFSTTLEGSFRSLRDSIVTLSAAVDSMGRQHDIALTTEAMRTNEQLLSLKSVIHGLRMQIHSMMAERNAQVMGREVVDAGPSSASENFWRPDPITGVIPPPGSHPFPFRYPHPPGFPPLARTTKL